MSLVETNLEGDVSSVGQRTLILHIRNAAEAGASVTFSI